MRLKGKRVAVLVEADYQDLEVWYPLLRLREEGAEVLVVGTGSATTYRGKNGYPIEVSLVASQVDARTLDGVVIPGGWVMASAGILRGRRVTGFRAIRDDLVHAGAEFVDAECVRDRNFITSRVPDDLPAFMRQTIAALAGE